MYARLCIHIYIYMHNNAMWCDDTRSGIWRRCSTVPCSTKLRWWMRFGEEYVELVCASYILPADIYPVLILQVQSISPPFYEFVVVQLVSFVMFIIEYKRHSKSCHDKHNNHSNHNDVRSPKLPDHQCKSHCNRSGNNCNHGKVFHENISLHNWVIW